MLRSRCVPSAAFVALLAIVCSWTASGAAITWVPTGLNPGDTYHLVFVTSGTRDATSSDINVYSTFVDTAMGAIDDASPYGDIDWKCIGSVLGTDARDNIGYASSTAPVYRLDDTRVAANSTAFWDTATTDLEAEIKIAEDLSSLEESDYAWTGSLSTGIGGVEVGLERVRYYGCPVLQEWRLDFRLHGAQG